MIAFPDHVQEPDTVAFGSICNIYKPDLDAFKFLDNIDQRGHLQSTHFVSAKIDQPCYLYAFRLFYIYIGNAGQLNPVHPLCAVEYAANCDPFIAFDIYT